MSAALGLAEVSSRAVSVESARVERADKLVSARSALVPFTPSWYALVVVGAAVCGGLVYLVVRAVAS